jgi:hypothetical protein
MKNITVSVDDETYDRARARAKDEGTSLSRIVKKGLEVFIAETDRQRSLRARQDFYAHVDAKFEGMRGDALYPGWRDDLYATARGELPDEDARAA